MNIIFSSTLNPSTASAGSHNLNAFIMPYVPKEIDSIHFVSVCAVCVRLCRLLFKDNT